MTNFSTVTQSPDVVAAVLTDPSGAVLQSSGRVDSETLGAVCAFIAQVFTRAGQELGLGDLQRAVVSGPGKTCIVHAWGQDVLGVQVDPSRPLPAIEKMLDTLQPH